MKPHLRTLRTAKPLNREKPNGDRAALAWDSAGAAELHCTYLRNAALMFEP